MAAPLARYYMNMHEDSPPPFIVIRTPKRRTPYERSLELVAVVQKLLDVTKARFHLKDRLDRAMTALVFELSNVRHQPRSVRWRHYRAAHKLANDCATILDILAHQEAAPVADLEAHQLRIEAGGLRVVDRVVGEHHMHVLVARRAVDGHLLHGALLWAAPP